jgi:hypothetical protein
MDLAIAEVEDGRGDGSQVLRLRADEEADDFNLASAVRLSGRPVRLPVVRKKAAAGYGHVEPRMSSLTGLHWGTIPGGRIVFGGGPGGPLII